MKKIIKKLTDKTWKKCLLIFIVIFIIMVASSSVTINYLNDVVNSNNIHEDRITIKDKIYGDSESNDYYIIIGTNNKTYTIITHGDDYGEKMFEGIEVGKTYKVIVREPELTNTHHTAHILQVYNETS